MYRFIPLLASALFLSACGGGGGGGATGGGGGATGGGGGTNNPVPFTSFGNLPVDGVVRIQGAAISATFDNGGTDLNLSEVVDDDSVYLDFTFIDGFLERVTVASTGAPIDLNLQDGASLLANLGQFRVLQSDDGQDMMVLADVRYAGVDPLEYDYQTFGFYLSGYDANATSTGAVGAGSFGILSDAGNLPSGEVDYSGFATGFLTRGGIGVDADVDYATFAQVQITANFATPEVTLSTSETVVWDVLDFTGLPTPAPELNYTGTAATISGGAFDGTLTSSITAGTYQGQFYGPNGEEVGGTFQTSGPGFDHVGSFGGKEDTGP